MHPCRWHSAFVWLFIALITIIQFQNGSRYPISFLQGGNDSVNNGTIATKKQAMSARGKTRALPGKKDYNFTIPPWDKTTHESISTIIKTRKSDNDVSTSHTNLPPIQVMEQHVHESVLGWNQSQFPLLPSERNFHQCHPSNPNFTRSHCCVGAISGGGDVKYRNSGACVRNKTIGDYDYAQAWTREYLQKHLPAPRRGDGCDICRIVDFLMEKNLTLSFIGDSVTKQVMTGGIECELRRRGYVVTKRVGKNLCRPLVGMTGIKAYQNLTVQYPGQTGNLARIHYYDAYRPNMTDMEVCYISVLATYIESDIY